MRILVNSMNLPARMAPLAFLDSSGKVVYNRSGETAGKRGDLSGLEEILKKLRVERNW